jgi:DNA-binding transcriptional regulator YdaS (Cro superfamily)
MTKTLTSDDLRRIAKRVNVHYTSLMQAMKGERNFSPAECVRIWQECDEEMKLWQLRPKDWHLIWPMLIGKRGTPPVPEKEKSSAGA